MKRKLLKAFRETRRYPLCPKVGETSTQHSLQSILKTLGYSPLAKAAYGKKVR